MASLASQFVALPPERRALAFTQTAARMAVSSVMVEKDFWASWLLGLLFTDQTLAPHLVFKGGTSLSKVYGVIDRFSEDIDLSMSPAFVGADESVFTAMKSRTRRDAALAQMQAQCGEQTRNVLMPRLEQVIVEHLGRRPGGASWLRCEDDAVARWPVVHFEYPTASEPGFEYLRREVKLELGSLSRWGWRSASFANLSASSTSHRYSASSLMDGPRPSEGSTMRTLLSRLPTIAHSI
jgi:hypothetical protein